MVRVPLIIAISVWNLFGLLTIPKGQITDLQTRCPEGVLLLSGTMGRLDERALLDSLKAGEQIDFYYQLEFCREREVWFDEVLQVFEFRKSLAYNNLTDQYFASFFEEERKKEEIILGDYYHGREWLITLNDLPVRTTFKPDPKCYLQMRVVIKKRRLLFVLPLETVTPWRRVAVACP